MPCRSLLLLTCFLTYSGLSQEFPFQYYSRENGLLADAVTTLHQDSRGYLLIGSAEGLSVFDGYSFTHYRAKDGLPANFINCISESRSSPGSIWIGTRNGLANLRQGVIRTLQLDTTTPNQTVYSLQEDASGTLWCGTRSGLYTIRGEFVERIDIDSMADPPIGVQVLSMQADSHVVVTAGKKLFSFNTPGALRHSLSFSDAIVASIADRYGNVWVGLEDNSVCLVRGDTINHQRRVPAEIYCLLEDPSGILHIGTDDGLFSIDVAEFADGEFARIGGESGLGKGKIIGGLIDREDNLWLCRENNGIAKLKTPGLQIFPISGIPEAYNNSRAACDSAGHFWIVSGDSLVEIQRLGASRWLVTRHAVVKNDPARPILGIVYDKRDILWINNQQHLLGFTVRRNKGQPSRLVPMKTITLPAGETVSWYPGTFALDRYGRIWQQVLNAGILVLDPMRDEQMKIYTSGDGIPDRDVRTLYEDKQGNMWIGGFEDGIALANADSLQFPLRILDVGKDIPLGSIRAFCEDGAGRMWVGTRYGGCMIMAGDSIQLLTTENSLPSDAVWAILRDNQNRMWLGTSMGLAVFDGETTRPVPIASDLVLEPVTALGTSPGGEVWFVTTRSFGVIEPEKLHTSATIPSTEISRVEVDEEPVDLSSPLEFPFDRNNCTFIFRSLSLHNTQDIRYQYRLIGVDHDWLSPSARRSVTYASLDPGEYRFEVRATRLASTQYGEPAHVSFLIAPPIWGLWWVRILAAFLVFALLAAAYRGRISILKRERQAEKEFSERLLASQEEERSRIAGELHDSLVQNLLIAKNRSLIGLERSGLDEARKELSAISSVMGDAIREVRDIAHNLRPYQLDRIGLTRAIQSLLEKINDSLPIAIVAEIDDIDRFFTPDKGIHLYRIVQEGVNNIIRHSGATEAAVKIKTVVGSVSITISDNGKGIPSLGPGGKGFGLSGLDQRARMLGGTFSVDTPVDNGTTLRVNIPVAGEAT